jgi:hypothetical protein
MIWSIFAIFVVLWHFGILTAYTMGGFLYLLLILAIITIAHRLRAGRRSV